MRIGVVDVGTNSVRLLVAETAAPVPPEPLAPPGDGGDVALRDLERDLVITRLGEGVDASRRLGDAPIERTVDAIASYVRRARNAGADALRIIATSAVRDATNRDVFVEAVVAATAIAPEVLAGETEARLGFLGATAGLAAREPYLVCDIGGGSTELVRGSAEADAWISLDVGSVRMTERHVAHDPPAPAELDAVRADVRARLDDAVRAVGAESPGTLVGLAGTITTVAAIALGLPGYDRHAIHHCRLARPVVGEIGARLAGMRTTQRRALPAMPRGREDVIVAGVVILQEVMDRFGCADVLVSESDILDGAALDLAAAALDS